MKGNNLIDFIKLINTQHGLKTKKIRVDNGGEFTSNMFKDFCRNKGIKLGYTLPYTPQENGTAERVNRMLLDRVNTKFIETNLPRELWGEAIQCSDYELNQTPTVVNNGETPVARWYSKNDIKINSFWKSSMGSNFAKTKQVRKKGTTMYTCWI